MKLKLLTSGMLLFTGLSVNGQFTLGEAASVYITTPQPDSSVAVYEKLGFTETASGNSPASWTLVSDGSLLMTLEKDTGSYTGLIYYAADPAKKAELLESDSIVFVQKPGPADSVQRYMIKTPDGFNIVLSGNPHGFKQPGGISLLNMAPADFGNAEKYPNPKCGVFGELALPVKDIHLSAAFWKKLGFVVKAEMNQPYPHMILSDGKMIIGLHQTTQFSFPAITYFGINTAQRVAQLKTDGLKGLRELMGADNFVADTWEGQHFFIFSLGM